MKMLPFAGIAGEDAFEEYYTINGSGWKKLVAEMQFEQELLHSSLLCSLPTEIYGNPNHSSRLYPIDGSDGLYQAKLELPSENLDVHDELVGKVLIYDIKAQEEVKRYNELTTDSFAEECGEEEKDSRDFNFLIDSFPIYFAVLAVEIPLHQQRLYKSSDIRILWSFPKNPYNSTLQCGLTDDFIFLNLQLPNERPSSG